MAVASTRSSVDKFELCKNQKVTLTNQEQIKSYMANENNEHEQEELKSKRIIKVMKYSKWLNT